MLLEHNTFTLRKKKKMSCHTRKLTAVVSMITTFSLEFPFVEYVTTALLICILLLVETSLFELFVVDTLVVIVFNAFRLLRSFVFNSDDNDERRRSCSSLLVVVGIKVSDVRLISIDVCCSVVWRDFLLLSRFRFVLRFAWVDDKWPWSGRVEVTGTLIDDWRICDPWEGNVRRSASWITSFVPDAFPTQCERKNVCALYIWKNTTERFWFDVICKKKTITVGRMRIIFFEWDPMQVHHQE